MSAAAMMFVLGVSTSIAGLIPSKISGCWAAVGSLSAVWHLAVIAVVRIKTIVYMTMKVAIPMKPRASSDKTSAIEPLRPVISIGRTTIWPVIEIAIRTSWLRADVDGNLRLSSGCGRYGKTKYKDKSKP